MFKKLTFLLAGAGLVILAACTPDKCKDKNCGTNGTCNIVSGNCDCTAGYEGATCTTLSRAKFVALYGAVETNSTGVATSPYSSDIIASTNTSLMTTVLISNFSQVFANNVSATVIGNNLTITRQQPDSDNYFVEGTGSINTTTNVVSMTYTVTNPANVVRSFTATYTRR